MARTLTNTIKTNDINIITNFGINLWQDAENFGRFKDNDERHTTWYNRHRLEVDLQDGKARWLTIHQGGHAVMFRITGPKYNNIAYIIHW